jgi:hypothetical protein
MVKNATLKRMASAKQAIVNEKDLDKKKQLLKQFRNFALEVRYFSKAQYLKDTWEENYKFIRDVDDDIDRQWGRKQ